jgi:DNA repair exonuclease SbcCD ATPase subunit
MSGVLGYALGYESGRSDAETSRANREIVDRLFCGQLPVQVDQSYVAQLEQLVQRFRADSDHNFDKANLFHKEALEWREDALRFEAEAVALQAQLSALQTTLAERNAALGQAKAALAEEQTAHDATDAESTASTSSG